MSQQEQILKRLHDSRQNGCPPIKIHGLAGPITATLSTSNYLSTDLDIHPSSASSSTNMHPSTSSSTINLNMSLPTSSNTHTKKNSSHKKDILPGAVISIEDHLRTQLRREKSQNLLLIEELKKSNLSSLKELNQSLTPKLQNANAKIRELENDNLKLRQSEKLTISTERVLSKVMLEDAGFIGKLHSAQLALLNPSQPKNLNTMSRKLMRKKARLQAYQRKKEAESLMNDLPKSDDQPIPSLTSSSKLLPPPVQCVPSYINLDFD